jgi:hypothetical protein
MDFGKLFEKGGSMNKNTAECIFYCAILLAMYGCQTHPSSEQQITIEAMKAGLIQKVDPETKQVIWTRP